MPQETPNYPGIGPTGNDLETGEETLPLHPLETYRKAFLTKLTRNGINIYPDQENSQLPMRTETQVLDAAQILWKRRQVRPAVELAFGIEPPENRDILHTAVCAVRGQIVEVDFKMYELDDQEMQKVLQLLWDARGNLQALEEHAMDRISTK